MPVLNVLRLTDEELGAVQTALARYYYSERDSAKKWKAIADAAPDIGKSRPQELADEANKRADAADALVRKLKNLP